MTQNGSNRAPVRSFEYADMFAAASTVYARNPEQYGKSNVQQLVPGHVNQIRKAGVRGTQTIIGAKPGTLDEEDKEAGKKLFAMLARKAPANR